MNESVRPANLFAIHVFLRIEVADLAGDGRVQSCGVKTGDRPDPAFAREQRLPERVCALQPGPAAGKTTRNVERPVRSGGVLGQEVHLDPQDWVPHVGAHVGEATLLEHDQGEFLGLAALPNGSGLKVLGRIRRAGHSGQLDRAKGTASPSVLG